MCKVLLQAIVNILEATGKMESLKKEIEELNVKLRIEKYNNQN